MAELERRSAIDNVNVTLKETLPVDGRSFPCPVCGVGLIVKLAKTKKPYCTCDDCGIQVFIRGKTGIKRFREVLSRGKFISGKESECGSSLTAYNRLEQLRLQKKELESRQGVIFRDKDLDNAIQAVDNEIERMQGVLDQMAGKSSERDET
jgi:predicted RNA-binding Zn-ribbon protein involved in translation (DUF1610 family)